MRLILRYGRKVKKRSRQRVWPMKLEINETDNGLRHYMDGIQIQSGDRIEIQFESVWIAGRYECCLKSPESPVWFYYSDNKKPFQLPGDIEVQLPIPASLRQSA